MDAQAFAELDRDGDEFDRYLMMAMMSTSRGVATAVRGSSAAVATGVGAAGHGIAAGGKAVGARIARAYHVRNDIPTPAQGQLNGGAMVSSLSTGADQLPGDKVDVRIDPVGPVGNENDENSADPQLSDMADADLSGQYAMLDGKHLNEADSVVVVLPGVDGSSYAGNLNVSKTLVNECGPDAAVVVVGGKLESEGLTEFSDQIKAANPAAKLTFVSHDSSNEVLSEAAQNGLKSDAVVLVGSPQSADKLAAAEVDLAGVDAKVYSKVVDNPHTAYSPTSDLVQGIGQVSEGRNTSMLTPVSRSAVDAGLATEHPASKTAMAGVVPADRITGASFGSSVASRGSGVGSYPGVQRER